MRTQIKEQDGYVHVRETEDAQPLLDANQRLRSIYDEIPNHGRNGRLAARVSATVAQNWANECGHPIGTQGYMAYAKRKLVTGDYSKFRIEGF